MRSSREEAADLDTARPSGFASPKRQLHRAGAMLSNLPAWLWLLVGFLLLPFTLVQTVSPLAAWVAPIFLLRFVRTSKRGALAILLIFIAYVIAIMIATRGGTAESLQILVVEIVLFVVTRSLLYTGAYAADRFVGSRIPVWPRLLVFPAAFTSAEWLLSLGMAPNTTGSLAYSQYPYLALIQLLSVTGMWGVIFLITWCASTVNMIWERGFENRACRQAATVIVAVLLVALAFGSLRLAFASDTGRTVEVAAVTLDSSVQQAAEAGIDWLALGQAAAPQREAVGVQLQPIINQMLERTELALQGGAKIVVWAEGSGTILEEDRPRVLAQVGSLAQAYDAYIEPALGVVIHTNASTFLLNQAVLIDPKGNALWTYEKTYPTVPVESYYTVAGPGLLPIAATPYGLMSGAICNDLHFPPLIRQAGARAADIFLAPVGDVHPFEVEDEAGATFRAVENGFSLVRPADYGFSTIVDPQGRVLARQDAMPNTGGIMMAAIPVRGVHTIYSRIGDSLAYLCVVASLFFAGMALLRRKHASAVPVAMKP
jgi:apolipoprotein N-acyltransferase